MQKLTQFKNYITISHYINNIGILSSFAFILLTLSILIPINLEGEKTLAASGDTSTTSLTLSTSGSAALDLLVTSDDGTFAQSSTTADAASTNSALTMNVSTNNYTGYTLSITAQSGTSLTATTKDANNNTVTDTLASLSTSDATTKGGITATTFNSSTYNNQWGFKPSYYNSVANNDKFYPSPTTSGVTLNRTKCANGSTNGTDACPNATDTYTIAIGARATYAKVAGTYTNTYILNAVGNYPAYAISYNANGGTGAPATQSAASTTNTSVDIALSSTEPTRTGYTFTSWCTENVTTCPSNKSYAAGATYSLETTVTNVTTLYAMWTINKYNITINKDSNISAITVTDSSSTTITPSSTSGNTYVYSLTYDQTYTITPTYASGYEADSITKSSGVGTLTAASDNASATFKVADGIATLALTAKSSGPCKPSGTTITTIGCLQDITSSNKASIMNSMTVNQQYQLADSRDNKKYYIAKLQTNSSAPGNPVSGYQIWMTQNLDLCIGCAAAQNSTGVATAALTSENTDLHAYNSGIYTSSTGYSYANGVITWTPATTAVTSGRTIPATGTGNVSGVTGWTNDYYKPYSAEGGDTYVITSGNNNTDTVSTSCSAGDTVCPHYHRGNYYNWTASIASNDSTSLTTNYTKADNSICPAGWMLPYGLTASAGYSDFNYLLKQQGIANNLVGAGSNAGWATNGLINIRTNPLYFVRAGYVYGSTLYSSGTVGYYWSGTVSGSNGAYYLYFSSSNVYPAVNGSRRGGWSIRCIVR